MKVPPSYLHALLDVSVSALGQIESARACAGVVYVYTLAGTADLARLERSANYLGTVLDPSCWYGKIPFETIGAASRITGTWPYELGRGNDLERHEFRVPDRFAALSELTLNESAECRWLNARAVLLHYTCLGDWADLASGAAEILVTEDKARGHWYLGSDSDGRPVFMRDVA